MTELLTEEEWLRKKIADTLKTFVSMYDPNNYYYRSSSAYELRKSSKDDYYYLKYFDRSPSYDRQLSKDIATAMSYTRHQLRSIKGIHNLTYFYSDHMLGFTFNSKENEECSLALQQNIETREAEKAEIKNQFEADVANVDLSKFKTTQKDKDRVRDIIIKGNAKAGSNSSMSDKPDKNNEYNYDKLARTMANAITTPDKALARFVASVEIGYPMNAFKEKAIELGISPEEIEAYLRKAGRSLVDTFLAKKYK